MQTSEMLDVQETQSEVMSVKDWLFTLFIGIIPFVNLIMLLVWAFSNNGNPNRQSYAKASLLFMVILIALFFFFFSTILGILASFAR